MKTPFVCAVVGAGLIAVLVLRSVTGSAELSAGAAATIAAQTLATEVEARVGPLPRPPGVRALIAGFLRPGAYLVTRFGFRTDGPAVALVALFASWWLWLAGLRLAWFWGGRHLGVAGAGQYCYWLWLTPPWRPFYRIWLVVARWWRQFAYGKRSTARWTGVLEAMTLPFIPRDSVLIGRLWACGFGLLQPLGIRGPRHITVVAAAGSGKTRWLMSWLGHLPRNASAFVVDCDGQIINALGGALERAGHRVLNFDPFGLNGFPSSSWNALDEITAAVRRHGRKSAVRFAQTLAEALIQDDNQHQPVFANTARTFLHGLLLYVWLFEPEERRNLVRVRALLTRGLPELVIDPKQDAFDLLLRRMEDATGYDDKCGGKITAVIARAAGVMRSGKGRDGNPFRTTAMSQTAWLDLPEIAEISTRSDVVGEQLKTGNPCVFICAPVTDIQTKLAGWVRALTMMTMYAYQNLPGRLKAPSAFLIEEAPSLGRIPILETAAPVFRKYGIRLVVVTRDLERLRQAYPQSYGGFIGNSQATLWMGTDHQETLERLSKMLGNTTRTEKVGGGAWPRTPPRMDKREQPLMTPDQLREFLDPARGQIIVTRTGKPPLRVAYEGCDRALPVWRFEHDKNFREPVLRALTRKALDWLWLRAPRRGARKMPRPPRCGQQGRK